LIIAVICFMTTPSFEFQPVALIKIHETAM
jgi:hypothetical protein